MINSRIRAKLPLAIQGPQDRQVMLVHLGEEAYSADSFRLFQQLPQHRHDDLHLITYLSGSNTYGLDGSLVSWQAPTGLMIDSGRLHEVRPQREGAIHYRQITLRVIDQNHQAQALTWHELAQSLGGNFEPAPSREAWTACSRHLQSAMFSAQNENSWTVSSHILAALGELHRPLATPLPRRLQKLRQQFKDQPNQSWDLQAMEHCTGWSAGHLHRQCQKYLNQTPTQLLMSIRLTAASEFLLATDAKLEVVAEAHGFADAFHFSKRFREYFGKPPSRWRKDHGGL